MAQWKTKIYVGDLIDAEVPDDISWEDKRDGIVARIKASAAYRSAVRIADDARADDYYDHEDFVNEVDELASARDADEWDDTMYHVYNYFDDQRIWFDIFDKNPPRPATLHMIPRQES